MSKPALLTFYQIRPALGYINLEKSLRQAEQSEYYNFANESCKLQKNGFYLNYKRNKTNGVPQG